VVFDRASQRKSFLFRFPASLFQQVRYSNGAPERWQQVLNRNVKIFSKYFSAPI
jgi:hypothetical protein